VNVKEVRELVEKEMLTNTVLTLQEIGILTLEETPELMSLEPEIIVNQEIQLS